jgi:DNA-3-methyladenine glycosylase I
VSDARAGLAQGEDGQWRCRWCEATPVYRAYHDSEWGFPVTDDRRLFEKLCLEAFRAGFANFDAEKMARFGAKDTARLLADAGIVRHAGKIASAINNAQRVIELREELGSLAAYAWGFEPDPKSRPKKVTHETLQTMVTSPESIAMSKDLKKRGWSFVGPTTVYAFMQAMGLVNDHVHGCHARDVALRQRAALKPPR